jgi:hypothetical protein
MIQDKKGGVHINLGFGGILTVAFIVLKLLGKIQWSWWWVLAPTWIPLAILLGLLVVVVVLKALCD